MSTSPESSGKRYAFVNLNNPEQAKDKHTRMQVAVHVGRHHRNRSRQVKTKATLPNVDISVPSGCAKVFTKRTQVHSDKVFHEETYRATLISRFRMVPIVRPKTSQHKPSCLSKPLFRSDRHSRPKSNKSSRSSPVGLSSPKSSPVDISASRANDKAVDSCNTSEECSNSVAEQNSAGRTFLFNVIDQSRQDPFAIYAVDDSSSLMSRLVDYAVHSFWSSMSPDRLYGSANPANYIYLTHMKCSSLAYYGYGITTSASFDFICDSNPLKKQHQLLRAKHIHEATTSLRRTIAAMPTNPSEVDANDELIGAVCALSSSAIIQVPSRKELPKSKFKSPLAAAQAIDMWGSFPLEKIHFQALLRLVRIRGGLNKLGSRYLAGTIQLADLLFNSRIPSKTGLPWCTIMIALPELTWPYRSPQSTYCSTSIASAFCYLPPQVLFRDDLGFAISAVAHTTSLLDVYQQSGRPDSFMVDLVESRNRAAYSVLNLPSAAVCTTSWYRKGCTDINCRHCDPQITAFSLLFEIVRLTLLIYNNIVVFPVPCTSDVSNRLANMLKIVLLSFIELSFPDSRITPNSKHSTLLLWSFMMGGISTYIDSDRKWYQSWFLILLNSRPDLKRWASIECVLDSFLWVDFVLGEEGVKFWSETVRNESETENAQMAPWLEVDSSSALLASEDLLNQTNTEPSPEASLLATISSIAC